MVKWAALACVGTSVIALSACAGTDKRRVVSVDVPTPIQTTSVRFDTPEAQAACETRKMRKRALDADFSNDIASITVEREISPGRRTQTDLDVNCRKYFASRLGGAAANPRTIKATTAPAPFVIEQTPAPAVIVRSIPQIIAAQPRTYRVRRGDTLSGIAREHCTGWKTLADENGIRDAGRIKPGQVLRLPAGSC